MASFVTVARSVGEHVVIICYKSVMNWILSPKMVVSLSSGVILLLLCFPGSFSCYYMACRMYSIYGSLIQVQSVWPNALPVAPACATHDERDSGQSVINVLSCLFA